MIQLATWTGYFVGLISIGYLIAWSSTNNPRHKTIWTRGAVLVVVIFGCLALIEALD